MFYDQAILKYHAADNWLASFLGNDQSADILYGRIPARTLPAGVAGAGRLSVSPLTLACSPESQHTVPEYPGTSMIQ